MILKRILVCIFALLSTSLIQGQEFTSIFNGKDLSGWSGDKALWSVKEGVITGVTNKEEPISHNKFLIWEGSVKDFVFKAQFRLTGNNNSGVQYRSQRFGDEAAYRVRGYQADIHANPPYTGMLYDEGGRGIVAQRGQKVIVNKEGKVEVKGETSEAIEEDLSKWNTIEIECIGNHLVHKINGKVTVDITDNDEKNREFEGILALQIHAGSPMTIEFKDLQIKHIAKKK
ncbi:MAG: hypothetical protein CMJ76_09470 [Planctomycetaceae bacterium]|nr:hypothetical protein [Planctomycetaceae bacterium]